MIEFITPYEEWKLKIQNSIKKKEKFLINVTCAFWTTDSFIKKHSSSLHAHETLRAKSDFYISHVVCFTKLFPKFKIFKLQITYLNMIHVRK